MESWYLYTTETISKFSTFCNLYYSALWIVSWSYVGHVQCNHNIAFQTVKEYVQYSDHCIISYICTTGIFFLIHNFEFRRYLYLLSIIFRISLFFCRMTREEFEVPISKEDWNKFIIATTLCAFIILIQIIINFIWRTYIRGIKVEIDLDHSGSHYCRPIWKHSRIFWTILGHF